MLKKAPVFPSKLESALEIEFTAAGDLAATWHGVGATICLTIPGPICRIDPRTIFDTPCVLDSTGDSVDR
jgi:hypothetical protein